jgi:excisionase family DNA binding protein
MGSGTQYGFELLTRQFYEWEIRGRGWRVWPRPVVLEPPFRPFFGHFLEGSNPTVDDGRRQTRLSSIFDRLKAAPNNELTVPVVVEPPLQYFEDDGPLIEIQIALPPETKVTRDAAAQFLLTLGHASRPTSFEIVGTQESIVVQLACAKRDARQVSQQLQAYFPDAIVITREGYLASRWDGRGRRAVVDFGLSNEFMRPLRGYERFEPDPLAGVLGAMSYLGDGEVAILQVLFAATRQAWPENIMRAVTDAAGDSFFADDPLMAKLAAAKVTKPLFAAVVRVAAQSIQEDRAWRVVETIGHSLRQFIDSPSNELIPLANDEYDDRHHARDVLARQSCRSGMLVNCDELLSIAHLPSASVRSPKLKREERRTKAPPELALGHELVLGENYHAGKTVRVSLEHEQRVRHMHLIGASGTGKSTLLLNMIVQDIKNGEGLAVLDPHGDLIDEILGHIPEERIADVVLLDPSDEEFPIGFNILSAHSELEKNLLASDLVSVFRRLSTSFGDQMNTVLANAIIAFLESGERATLSDLRRFLVEPAFRGRFLETVRDPDIVYYWQKEFPLLGGRPQGPILTRLDTFLRPKVIRHMVSQKENRLNFGSIMNSRKILLAKLAQGLIGEENSYLLGTLVVAKLNQTAMSRQSIAASERKHFYLYVDEFHNFVTPSMAAILAGARKYNLGLILAHQELQQLANRDNDVASAVISNPYARVCFRLGDFDAKKLEDGFSFFNAKELQNLGVGEAICRMERSEYDFNLKTVRLPSVAPDRAARRKEQILASSRERYATSREAVEAMLRSSHSTATESAADTRKTAKARSSIVPRTEKVVKEAEATTPIGVPGRGGDHHKYLQQLIKRWAEAREYTVAIEKPILDGLGSVDVALEKGSRTIACEISVTTDPQHEVGNVQKCLASGFELVILISSEKKLLTAARHALVSALSSAQFRQVKFLAPEEAFALIEGLEAKTENAAVTVDANELLTAKEVGELLRIDVKTVYSYVQKGILPYVKIQSNVRFVRSEILKWMEEKQYKPGGRAARR